MKFIFRRDFLWILPLSLAFGAVLSSLQPGDWFIGWLAFSFLFLLSFSLLTIATRWAAVGLDTWRGAPLLDHRRILAWMVALAFCMRLAGGIATYLLLPINGYDEPDDRAGFVFTDAHRRDEQAWELAQSDQSILSAFDKSFHTDQYGGLLAFSALAYRLFSPDAHRPLLLVLLTAMVAALGVPFLWKAVGRLWGERVAVAAGWIFALYPESLLLGGAAMREPYLMTFSAMALWGFVSWIQTGGRVASGAAGATSVSRPGATHESALVLAKGGLDTWRGAPLLDQRSLLWLVIGLAGMLLVSPAVALVTLVIFGGWLYFASGRGRIPWWAPAAAMILFAAGLFLLSSALNRQGDLGALTPFGVVNNWLREAVKWDVYQLERGSGWVQKLFDEMPGWMRLLFVMVYGIFQPVLPAALVEPTTATWKIIAILRAAGWYALLPALVLSFAAAAGSGAEKDRKVLLWLGFICWSWILLTALRGGGDQWDNPRYRALLFAWQAVLAGSAFVRWREARTVWFPLIAACEIVFLAVFTQWYASRYFHWGGQIPFAGMVALILGLWAVILIGGWFWRPLQERLRK